MKILGRFIVTDPKICHGQPTFRGTRVFVADVLDQVARGLDWETIIEEWRGFYRREVCHRQYGIVYLEVAPEEVAIFVRRVLRHSRLSPQAKRMGTVVRASHRRLGVWRLHAQGEEVILWRAPRA